MSKIKIRIKNKRYFKNETKRFYFGNMGGLKKNEAYLWNRAGWSCSALYRNEGII